MKHPTLIAFALLTACGGSGSSNTTPDATAPTDSFVPGRDIPRSDTTVSNDGPTGADARTDAGVPTDLGVSRAGGTCATDTECGGGLMCATDYVGGYCTHECTDDPMQAREQAQCGGRGSTCVTIGEGTDAYSECTHACSPTARTEATGACRANQVCTGWWYTHMGGEPDATGCQFYCSTDAHCPTGEHCNLRLGECGAAFDQTRRADGEPCDPTVVVTVPGVMDPQNVQCRGICFQSTDSARQGVCGSFLNLANGTMCPDNPTRIHAEAPSGTDGYDDNLALCLYKECTSNADCTAPLICFPGTMGDPDLCDYPAAAMPDAGVRDVGGGG